MLARGTRVEAFEQAISQQLGASGGIACASGTAALSLALKTLGIREGDEIILPTYVCWNVLAAVTASGATPRLCDVDNSGVLTIKTASVVLSTKTKAIIAVHIFGHPCDIEGLAKLGPPVIEDACQSLGLELNDQPAGTVGTLGILSFHATKCLTTGEGGMLITRNMDLLERARYLTASSEVGNMAGLTAMTELQAALGLAQIGRYPAFLERRRQLLAKYHESACALFTAHPGYHDRADFLFRYTLHTQSGFETAQQGFLSRGVHARRGVDELLHRRLGLNDHDFPGAAELFDKNISVPFYPSLNEREAAKVVSAMREVFGAA